MRRAFLNVRAATLLAALVTSSACRDDDAPDAYGNFEATEVVVSSQGSGQILEFVPVEGMRLDSGAVVVRLDTVPLTLEEAQLEAQRVAVGSRGSEVSEQLRALEVQYEIARRNYERTRRLHAEQAATSQQLDQAEREYRVLEAQIQAARAQRRSVGLDVASTAARVAQVRDRLERSVVRNPRGGTVLAVYARAGEVVQNGTPLYKVADLDTLELRAYLEEPQLALVKLGQVVQVRVDRGRGELLTLPGTISWIASRAEFTPTPIQTREERTDLVYAVKVRVANRDGVLKIGMPADLTIGVAAPAEQP
jgi:HlyD family secretion protein